MRLQDVRIFLIDTLRGRLVLSVALVHAVMMALFIVDLTARQKSMILENQAAEAVAMSQALAASAAGWIASNDISGMQELVEAELRYPNLLFAMLADKDRRILAHTDENKRGLFLTDLPKDIRQAMLSRSSSLVDVAVPALLRKKHVGWARVGIGQKQAAEKLDAITGMGVLYALGAIAIGSFVALFTGQRITRRLYAVQDTISRVRMGDRKARSDITGRDEAASIAQEFNAMLDILEEREAELRAADEELNASEERFQVLFDSSPVPILLTKFEDGLLVNANIAAESLFGYSKSEIQGETTADLGIWLSAEDRQAAKEKLLTNGFVRDYETRVRSKSGAIIDIIFNTDVISLGGTKYLLSAYTDITERKQAEEAIVARRAAEEASRAKSDFLANMSHELRTPLNSVIGFSEILEDQLYGGLNEKQLEYVRDISSSGRHLLNLINDILDLSKVEAGKLELALSAFPLSSAIYSAMTMFKEKAMKHAIKLDFEIAPDADIEIEADERKLKQIIFNLLSNAMKFTPNGGGVHVAARPVKGLEVGNASDPSSPPLKIRGGEGGLMMPRGRDGDFVEISVSDTGIGIKQEDLRKLFHEFTQLESAYTKNHEGTGLGLALTKKLVELHGGRIWCESEFGKGSRFVFVMPIKQNSEAEIEESK